MEVVNFYFEDDINIPLYLYSNMAEIGYAGTPAMTRARMSNDVRGRETKVGTLRLLLRRMSKGTDADGQLRTNSIGQAWVGGHVNGDLGRLLR